MSTFVGMTGVAQSVVRADLRRHDESGAVCRGRRPSSARRAWRRLSWMPVVAGMTSVAQAVMHAGRRRQDEKGAGCPVVTTAVRRG
ncbi:MAG TPA: hypothetical protein VK741_01740 [Acetobacteraceae bacterium]|jgi:hypothetical protein|nr:hypothetical protein [Acetobacteraceae bacterium]